MHRLSTPVQKILIQIAIIAVLPCLSLASAAELLVGTGKTYTKPSLAAAACANGDTISIDAGTYTGDVCTWTKSNLLIRGMGGKAHIKGVYNTVSGGKGLWVLAGNNITVENIEFSNAAIPDNPLNPNQGSANAAGIRAEGIGLTVRHCYFHNNQNGILTAPGTTSDILIEYSEFANNGFGDGYSHNLYIGNVRTLTFQYNYSHHARVGHNLKSRAQNNYIRYNRVMDESTGDSSYVIDISNGGLTYLIGNLIQQGPLTQNHSFLVRYGHEGATNPIQHLYAINNTVVNDYTGTGTINFFGVAATTTVYQSQNNLFLGSGTKYYGRTPTIDLNNLLTNSSLLVNRSGFDYHLATGTNAAVDAGANPGTGDSYTLLPSQEYAHTSNKVTRTTAGAAVDMGAYERGSAPVNHAPAVAAVIPNRSATVSSAFSFTPSAGSFTDSDGDPLTWSASGLPAWLSFNTGTRTFSGTPAAGNVGSSVITVKATDPGSLFVTTTFTITVSAVNLAPVVAAAIPNRPATAGSPFSFTPSAGTFTDPNGDVLAWSASGLPAWLSFNTGTHTFSGTPAAGNVGSSVITVKATDPGSLFVTTTFTITVSASAPPPTSIPATPTSSKSGGCGAGSGIALLMMLGLLWMCSPARPRRSNT